MTQILKELEESDPEVRAAAENYEKVKEEILAVIVTEPIQDPNIRARQKEFQEAVAWLKNNCEIDYILDNFAVFKSTLDRYIAGKVLPAKMVTDRWIAFTNLEQDKEKK